MSSGARIVTFITPETTPGETPAAPSWQTLRLTGNTLSPQVGTEQSNEIRPDRMASGSIITSQDYSGDLNYEFSATTFDELLAAAFYGTWQSDTPVVGEDTLEIGEARQSFSVVKGYKDVDVWTTFTGVHISQFTLTIPEEGKVNGTFTCMGMGFSDGVTDPTAGGTVVIPTTTAIMGSATSVGDVEIDDVVMTGQACISAMSLDINNSLQAQRCLGLLGPGNLIATQSIITGSVTLAWANDSYLIWKKMMTREAVKLSFPINDSAGNTYTFEVPEAELDGPLPDGGNTDIVQVTLNLTAKITPVKVVRALA